MDSKTYHYYERLGVERVDRRLTFKANKIPPHCEKKVMIHSEFVKHISGDTSGADQSANEKPQPGEQICYVYKWIRV